MLYLVYTVHRKTQCILWVNLKHMRVPKLSTHKHF
uniref:Uncharacterized protein n=1 Tax=Anguilla anguilla TaxID=7936 RepID=A0A0E9QU49_ANGAN